MNTGYNIISKLQAHGFQAFFVGGYVRDKLLGLPPNDVDIATNANLEELLKIFPCAEIIGAAFSVALINNIEVATFRIDGPYSDARHPDYIKTVDTLKEDLARRDFTINALAESLDGAIIDYFDGQKDLKDRIIRFVGDPQKRIEEDPLRMIRACRFAAKINGVIEPNSFKAIKENAEKILGLSAERKQAEIITIMSYEQRNIALNLLNECNLLKYFIEEMSVLVGFEQNKYHLEDCWKHSVDTCLALKKADTKLRLAAWLHDVGKPESFGINEKNERTFYNHERFSAIIAEKILKELKFSNEYIAFITEIIGFHMDFLLLSKIDERRVRRQLSKLCHCKIRDLLRMQLADILGNSRELFTKKQIQQDLKDTLKIIRATERSDAAVKLKDLKINGTDLMQEFKLKPGPIIKKILEACLDQVINEPENNTRENLLNFSAKFIEDFS